MLLSVSAVLVSIAHIQNTNQERSLGGVGCGATGLKGVGCRDFEIVGVELIRKPKLNPKN